jgi:hypothetical protein
MQYNKLLVVFSMIGENVQPGSPCKGVFSSEMLATVGLRRALRSFEGDGYNLKVFVYEEQHDFSIFEQGHF